MNSSLKKLQAIALVWLIVMTNLIAAAQQPISVKIYSDYGLVSEAPRPSALMSKARPVVPPGMNVDKIRRSRLMFRVAGGIMLDAVGQPCDQLATTRLSLTYDVRRAIGKRLVLRANNKVYSVEGVDDRDLRAIAEFAENQNPVLINATIPRIEGKEKSCPNPDGLRLIDAHPAFLNTRLSWLLTRMDTIPWSFSDGKRWATKDSLPARTLTLSKQLNDALQVDYDKYTQRQYADIRLLIVAGSSTLDRLSQALRDDLKQIVALRSSASWEKYEADILKNAEIDLKAWDKLSVTDRRALLLVGMASGTERVSNINDHESSPNFCVENSAVVFDGTPRLEFFRARYEESYRFETSSNLMSRNFTQLRLIDQEAYDATMEIYRLGGLFRYVRNQQSPILWKRFVKSLPQKSGGNNIEIACPSCTKDQVSKWLACLSS